MRAREADREGFVERDGVKVGYEVFGSGTPTLLLLPTWTIVHSRFWKMQVPYFARHFRVVTFDGPGNGRSDRPLDPGAYGADAVAQHALAVMDATQTDQAVIVGLSAGVRWGCKLAADHPDRVLGAVFIGPGLAVEPLLEGRMEAVSHFFDPAPVEPKGWERMNANYWLEHYDDFVEFFFEHCFTEAHSTKPREDCVRWALDTTPEVLLSDAASVTTPEALAEMAERITAPTLVIHGDQDEIAPLERGRLLAEQTRGEFVVLEGAGHIPLARDPVRVNLLIRDFVDRVTAPVPERPATRHWARGRSRPKRALYISSPIGLGHARRDLAIADELRKLHPDLEIEWLAQHPVTRVLEHAGEHVHPASTHLANESAHLESESDEHDLHCFQAWRNMDEILLADFMVFHDVVTSRDYDLVVGDEAWDVDYYLHENPELKRFAYCWFTDFVGWLPMPDGGERESFVTADYNAEMIEHIARYPRVRDLALFVGDPDDIVPDHFGPNLPEIRDWTERNFQFPGYITGFDPSALADRESLRDSLGYAPDERVCIVAVGGSAVGTTLLQRCIDAYPQAAARVPGLRMVVIAGPRIDPDALPTRKGVEVRSYVPDLHRHLAAGDLAVVQGGLTTCMELTATARPFVYVPLRHHFEQNFHVTHRLDRYGAGRRLDFGDTDPESLAETIAGTIEQDVHYAPVQRDGATRAAALMAELL
jgi:pimeloyl-ACP methyl ester carboxylesterase